MTCHYQDVQASLDRAQSDEPAAPRSPDRVYLLICDWPGDCAREPVSVCLLAAETRRLAHELLELAEQADPQSKPLSS